MNHIFLLQKKINDLESNVEREVDKRTIQVQEENSNLQNEIKTLKNKLKTVKDKVKQVKNEGDGEIKKLRVYINILFIQLNRVILINSIKMLMIIRMKEII